MSISTDYRFTQSTNATTGCFEWVCNSIGEDDYFTEIARSSYADMLHDTERNQLYHRAIFRSVQALKKQRKKVKVLDIGTGSGILAMMAAKAGADIITAVEEFTPMAKAARKIIELNGFFNIKVVGKNSKSITIGENKDMEEKANLLVTELFDTELIGEGALCTYRHALINLMEDDCIAVPHRAIVKAVLVESPLMRSWFNLNEVYIPASDDYENTINVLPDYDMQISGGMSGVNDIQLSQFPRNQLKELTDPFTVLELDWTDKELMEEFYLNFLTVKSICDGKVQAVISWWDLEMESEGKIVLTTAPRWHHPTPNDMQWRDHWLQSVYNIPLPFECRKGELIYVKADHDSCSFDFDASLNRADLTRCRPLHPFGISWSRTRLGKINDQKTNQLYVDTLRRLRKIIPTEGIIFCASDFGLLPIFIEQSYPERKVVSMEQHSFSQQSHQKFMAFNQSIVEVIFSNIAEIGNNLSNRKIALLCGEPHFSSSLLPWHNLFFWYLRTALSFHLKDDFKVMPYRAHLCAVGVWLKDLWKIRARVGVVEGFDLSPLDEMVEKALEHREYHEPESHPLWEYESKLLTPPTTLMSFNFENPVPKEKIIAKGHIEFLNEAVQSINSCHAVVLWMNYNLDRFASLSTGLLTPKDEFFLNWNSPSWNMHHKQAVFLFRRPKSISHDNKLYYDVTFNPETGNFRMNFDVTRS